MKHKRSHRLDRLAKVYDAEILPLWSERFGRPLLRRLQIPPKAMVLDVGAGTGYPALELLRHMDDTGRVISIDPSSAMLDVAREKAGALAGKRIFFRSESAEPKLSFADEVFDLVVCNLALAEMEDPARALRDFARVAKPGGKVVVTLPLERTFDEFHDLFREALVELGRKDGLARLEAHLAAQPTARSLGGWLEAAGLRDVEVEQEQYQLLFRSSNEFFFAPLIEFGPLSAWKEIAGTGEAMQEVFWRVKESMDTYFGQRAFAVTVRVGCASGRRATEAEAIEESYGVTPLPPRGASAPWAVAGGAPPEYTSTSTSTATAASAAAAAAAVAASLDGPTGEITLHTAEFELVEATQNSYVGEVPAGSLAPGEGGGGFGDEAGDGEVTDGSGALGALGDAADAGGPDSELFTSPGGRLRRR